MFSRLPEHAGTTSYTETSSTRCILSTLLCVLAEGHRGSAQYIRLCMGVGFPKLGGQFPEFLHIASNCHSLQWLYNPAGLEESLSNMARGEKAVFSCPAEYARGSSLLPNPPSNSDTVELELHLLSLTQVSKVIANAHLVTLF